MDMKIPLEAENKTKALQKISEEAASIGTKVRESDMSNDEFFYAVIKARYYKRKSSELTEEGQRESQLQPESSVMPKEYVVLSLKYQFRKNGVSFQTGEVGGPGYIVSVKKTRKKKPEAVGEMTNSELFNPEQEYSNRHESTEGSILEHTYKNSNEEGQKADVRSKNFDAYTKLAGEGARFKCVRRNIDTIKDETVFYAAGQTKGVKFSELWLTWSATFEKKYDIEDKEIADELRDTGFGKPANTLCTFRDKFNTLYNKYTTAVPIHGAHSIELQG